MTTVMVTVCDCCENRILTGAMVIELHFKTYELNVGNSSEQVVLVEVCGECAASKRFKLDVRKGLVIS